jgi:hypothetical protein
MHGRDEKFVKNFVGEVSGKTAVARTFIKMAVETKRFKGMARILVGSHWHTEGNFFYHCDEIREFVIHLRLLNLCIF